MDLKETWDRKEIGINYRRYYEGIKKSPKGSDVFTGKHIRKNINKFK